MCAGQCLIARLVVSGLQTTCRTCPGGYAASAMFAEGMGAASLIATVSGSLKLTFTSPGLKRWMSRPLSDGLSEDKGF